VQPDGDLAFATGDTNVGRTPDIRGAAYTNNDRDDATGTVNYAIDATLGILATQGRPDNAGTPDTDETVSPNTGQLFTVGSLGWAACRVGASRLKS
jgi:hypothetical protein